MEKGREREREKERERERERELKELKEREMKDKVEREAEKERERQREKEIRAFREFSTKLPISTKPTRRSHDDLSDVQLPSSSFMPPIGHSLGVGIAGLQPLSLHPAGPQGPPGQVVDAMGLRKTPRQIALMMSPLEGAAAVNATAATSSSSAAVVGGAGLVGNPVLQPTQPLRSRGGVRPAQLGQQPTPPGWDALSGVQRQQLYGKSPSSQQVTSSSSSVLEQQQQLLHQQQPSVGYSPRFGLQPMPSLQNNNGNGMLPQLFPVNYAHLNAPNGVQVPMYAHPGGMAVPMTQTSYEAQFLAHNNVMREQIAASMGPPAQGNSHGLDLRGFVPQNLNQLAPAHRGPSVSDTDQ
jgi:hypothetical protein